MSQEQAQLDRIRVVLVQPSHPGNVGAAARAMKTMGLSRLVLVAPEGAPHRAPEAVARASGAGDVLAAARVAATLEEALAGVSLAAGASARRRTISWPTVTAREAGPRLAAHAAAGAEAAVVFGRETSGLTNAELERCHLLLAIPANPEYGSLNLAAAVQVVAYELRLAVLAGEGGLPPAEATDQPPATAEELEGLYAHLERALVALDFLDPDNPRQLMRRLRRLFNRAGLDRMEVNILRGILAAAEAAARRRGGNS